MYAVVSSGGKQYRVEPGTTLTLERLGADAGAAVTFDRVLLIADGEAVTVGSPVVSGATVTGTVLGEELGPKLVVFKFKQKVKYRRRTGHRQHLVRVRIDTINADGDKPAKSRASAEAKAAPEAKPADEVVAATDVTKAARPRARRTKPPEESTPKASNRKASARKAAAPKASAAKEKPAAKPRAARKPKAKAEE